MKVSKVMSKTFKKLKTKDPISKAIHLMISIPESALPVLDEKGNFVGELSQKELLLIDIGEKEFKDELLAFDQIKMLTAKGAKIVEDLMNRHEVTVSPDDDALYAAKLMYDEDVSTVPVIKGKKLVGVITEIDILKHYKKLMKNGR